MSAMDFAKMPRGRIWTTRLLQCIVPVEIGESMVSGTFCRFWNLLSFLDHRFFLFLK
jgi:hypothetical protein